MKAAVWHSRKEVRIEDVPVRQVGPGEVKVQVAYTGICGSDLHEYAEGPIFIPVEEPNEFTKKQAPVVLGHEFSGIVVEKDSTVTNVEIGDRVSIYPTIANEKKDENYDIYDGFNFIGYAQDGGFAEFCTLSAKAVYKLPEHMTLAQGALVEPTAVAVQAIKEGGVRFGDKVAIFGAGPIGCLVAAAAKAAGASEIIVCDLAQDRLEKALEMGATKVINSGNENAVQKIKEITAGGADVAFEVAGVAITLKQAIAATKARGTMVIVSVFAKEIPWNPMDLVNSGVKVTSTIAYTRSTFQETIAGIGSGQLVVSPLVTKEIQLADVVAEGFETLLVDKSQSKILVKIN